MNQKHPYKRYLYHLFFWLVRQDMWIWFCLFCLLLYGLIFLFSIASMNHSSDISLVSFWQKINKKIALYIVTFFVMVIFSHTPIKLLKKMTPLFFLCVFIVLLATSLGLGKVVKGARRWISILGITFQASELMKPALILLSAHFLDSVKKDQSNSIEWWQHRYHFFLFFFLLLNVSFLLLMQPDVGTTFLLNTTIVTQFFSVGFPLWLISFTGFGGCLLTYMSYMIFPHVTKRIDSFLGWTAVDQYGQSYQLCQAAAAFKKGGFFGIGLSEGEVKYYIPDLHNDFVIALIGEEVGFFGCLILLLLFFTLIVRLLIQSYQKRHDTFQSLSLLGIAICFLGQTFIHIASATGLIPPKGMTLPFISAGGTALIVNGIMMGLSLCLTKKNSYTK